MNLIDYNKVLDALDKERQFLLNREQYGAENVLVHHAINVIAELPIVRQPEIVRCKDCVHRGKVEKCVLAAIAAEKNYPLFMLDNRGEWFCADGKRKEGR